MFLFRAITDRKLSWGGSHSHVALRLGKHRHRNLTGSRDCLLFLIGYVRKHSVNIGACDINNFPYFIEISLGLIGETRDCQTSRFHHSRKRFSTLKIIIIIINFIQERKNAKYYYFFWISGKMQVHAHRCEKSLFGFKVSGHKRWIVTEATLRPRQNVSGYFSIRNFFLTGYGFRPHASGQIR